MVQMKDLGWKNKFNMDNLIAPSKSLNQHVHLIPSLSRLNVKSKFNLLPNIKFYTVVPGCPVDL